MIKDRAQKALALRLSVSKRWLPQLEVEVESSQRLERARNLLTDIDVLAISQSSIALHERFVFDCKSGSKESAIGRSFWLRGVMTRVGAKHGFVVLPEKIKILHDHRISAADMSISLMHDAELVEFSRNIGGTTDSVGSLAAEMDAWDAFLSISSKYPALTDYLSFARSGFWMRNDPGDRCRRLVSRLRAIRSELDPVKPEHMSVFGDAVCLLLVAVSELAARALLILLKPASKEDFSSTVLAMLYGGYDNLDAAIKLKRIASGVGDGDEVSIFPELGRFEHLVREMMQAPLDSIPAALLSREIAFSQLVATADSALFQKELASDARFSTKFMLLAAEYLERAARLPPEFGSLFRETALDLMAVTSRSSS